MAPQRFHDWLASLLLSIGFRPMVGHPAYFRHDEKDVEIVIHIDDGIIAGPLAQVTEVKQTVQGKVATKYLGKIFKGTTKGFTIQADSEFYDTFLRRQGWNRELHLHTWNKCDEAHCCVGKGGLG